MNPPWWEQPALSFDTESTGLNVLTDRIVTVALVTVGDGKPACESHLINPGVEIPKAASAIHGISTERAKAEGKEPAPILDATADALALALSKGQPVVGMNLAYDFSLLHAECVRHEVETVSSRLGGHDKLRPIVDALVLDGYVSRRAGRRRLSDLCDHYSVRHHGAHDSGYDALAAAEVVAQIMQRYPHLGALSLDELHTAQITWKAERDASYQAYRRRQEGNDSFNADWGWPLYDEVLNIEAVTS